MDFNLIDLNLRFASYHASNSQRKQRRKSSIADIYFIYLPSLYPFEFRIIAARVIVLFFLTAIVWLNLQKYKNWQNIFSIRLWRAKFSVNLFIPLSRNRLIIQRILKLFGLVPALIWILKFFRNSIQREKCEIKVINR